MRRFYFVASALLSLAVSVSLGQAPPLGSTPGFITSALADPGRSERDRSRDAIRKTAESLQFSGIKPGDVVADYNARDGYFTRLFADVVGSSGHVYAVQASETMVYPQVKQEADALEGYAVHQPNITVLVAPALEALRIPRTLDLFWISRNYHDLYNKNFGPVDIAAFNKAVFNALRPGGTYIILDHRAATGAPVNVTETLHRIEPATVRRDVEAAGFRFDGESEVLANPSDHLTNSIFDNSMYDHTNQFILKFRRP